MLKEAKEGAGNERKKTDHVEGASSARIFLAEIEISSKY